jgi:chemotaxis protein MotB
MERRRKRKPEQGAPKWMTTYSDMVTLILVFFILLFSMSQIDQLKFKSISESFQNRGILDFLPSHIPENQVPREPDLDITAKDFNQGNKEPMITKENHDTTIDLKENIDHYLHTENLQDVVATKQTEDGVSLILQDNILFDSGKANILATATALLDKVGGLLQEMPNHVRVEGHTDYLPIATQQFPSNWELSGARAGSVVRYFIEEQSFKESRFSIAGYGDTKPIVENNSATNLAKNRRVEIVILEKGVEDN